MNKIYEFGSIGNKKIEWIILDNEDDLLLISVDPFGCDNSLYLDKFFKNNEINKYFKEEELARITEVRLFTIDEYEVYKNNYDLKTPYKWYLSQNLECINGDNVERYYSIVNKININKDDKQPDNYQDVLDIIQIVYDNNVNLMVTSTVDRDGNDVPWDYSIRPVIRINK